MGSDLKVGQRLGNWMVDEQVGRGGNARVYRVRSANDPRVAALKILYRKTAESEARFRRECSLAASLPSDDSLIKIVDIAPESDPIGLWYVMEYIQGPTLQDDRERFIGQLELALDTVERASLAVGKLHVGGIVHRDLKPDNILLRKPDVPVVVDFGLCWLRDYSTERLTPDDRCTGAWGFRAPEHEHARVEEVNATADVFSLVKILWWLLHGGPPFAAAHWEGSESDLARKHSDARMHAIHALMRKVIVPDPSKRLVRSGDELAGELATIRSQLVSPSSGRLSAAVSTALASRLRREEAIVEHAERVQRRDENFPALREKLYSCAQAVAKEVQLAFEASGEKVLRADAVDQLGSRFPPKPNCVGITLANYQAFVEFSEATSANTGRRVITKIVAKCSRDGYDMSDLKGFGWCGEYTLDLVGDETVLRRLKGPDKDKLLEPAVFWEEVAGQLLRLI